MRKNIPKSEHVYFDERDCTINDFWDTVKVARGDDVVISETLATHHYITITHRILNVVHYSQKSVGAIEIEKPRTTGEIG